MKDISKEIEKLQNTMERAIADQDFYKQEELARELVELQNGLDLL